MESMGDDIDRLDILGLVPYPKPLKVKYSLLRSFGVVFVHDFSSTLLSKSKIPLVSNDLLPGTGPLLSGRRQHVLSAEGRARLVYLRVRICAREPQESPHAGEQ